MFYKITTKLILKLFLGLLHGDARRVTQRCAKILNKSKFYILNRTQPLRHKIFIEIEIPEPHWGHIFYRYIYRSDGALRQNQYRFL